MSARGIKWSVLVALCVAAVGVAAAPAQAAPNDPLFLLRPFPIFGQKEPIPPPTSTFEGPCGLAVDNSGSVYLSDYYHNVVDIYSGGGLNPDGEVSYGYAGQYPDPDPVDAPCGLALDAAGGVYVNEYHRSVIKLNSGVITGAPLNAARPTGVAVDKVTETLYVNERNRIAVFDLAGASLGTIGAGNLADSYGLAVSRYEKTQGYIYAPDAATNTLKVYAPVLGGIAPVLTISGSDTPQGGFVSLEDSSVAVDNVTGEIYVVDNLQPDATEKPEAVVQVFDYTGKYKGRLKYSVIFGQSVGLAVDNSEGPYQGRVFVTSGNTDSAAFYGYPPHAASDEGVPLPEPRVLEPVDEGYDPGGGGSKSVAAVSSVAAPPAASTAAQATPASAATAKAGSSAKGKKKTSKRRRARLARAAR